MAVTFPGRTFCPFQHDFDRLQLGSIPVLLQNTPATLNRIVLAVVRWIIQQLDDFAGVVDEVHEALEELRTDATAFRAIVELYLDLRHSRPFMLWDALPPAHQAIYDEIAGLVRASECQI